MLVGCSSRQEKTVVPTAPMVIHDTVNTVLYVTDSSALQATTKYYQRERKKKDSVYSQNQYIYLKKIVKLDSTMAVMQDSLVTLKYENRRITAEIEKLQKQATTPLTTIAPPEPDSIKEMRTRMEWLLSQERKIFTLGTEDKANDVEVTHVYTDADKIYVAIRTGEAAQASAAMNEKQALFAYKTDNSQVFVFNYPQVDKIELNFTLNSRQYKIQTTLKTLLGKAIK